MAATFPVSPAKLRRRSLDFAARARRTGCLVWQARHRRKAAFLRCVLGSQRADRPSDDRLLEIHVRPYVPSVGLHSKDSRYWLTLDTPEPLVGGHAIESNRHVQSCGISSLRIPVGMWRPAGTRKALGWSTGGGRRGTLLPFRTCSMSGRRYKTSGRPCGATNRIVDIVCVGQRGRGFWLGRARDPRLRTIWRGHPRGHPCPSIMTEFG